MSELDMTDEAIVAGLRSEDMDDRQKALEALFPDASEHGGAVLVKLNAMSAVTSTTEAVDAGRLFTVLLFLAQQFGTHLGLKLDWIADPAQGDKIITAPPFGHPFKA